MFPDFLFTLNLSPCVIVTITGVKETRHAKDSTKGPLFTDGH